MLRSIAATIIGLISASLTVYVIESLIGHHLFPLPLGADPLNIEWLSTHMHEIPVGMKICVVLAHFIGIMAGMFVAAKISKKSIIPSYIVGIMMLFATLSNIIMLPKEFWFTLSDGSLALLGFFLGKSLAKKQLQF
ncbi:hypothetical protein [Winogradskyella arenosi]|uniref:Uncharacterized protein n=1 Tax=Winogradskyella arenosi TaxID=533325 RepID=A0A368ZE56_9FLAO|nr:hypothetical protein [Winogradskyella arenosi]RCW91530.1 hypothetical protein DFQ08_103360 [Winogradskyella arenosi]